MIIRVVGIVVIQRQLSRAIQVVRAVVITRQLLHPRLHQLQLLHRHQLLHLSQSQSQMYGIAFGRVLQIIIMQLVEVAMPMVQVIMQVFVVYGGLIEFPLVTQRQVLDFRFGY